MTKQLSVRLYGKEVGVLEQDSDGKMFFTYNPDATEAISFSMPVQEQSYSARQCEAFFGGLLPEGDGAKKAIGQRYGVSPNNSFSLLKVIGYDCAGAISFHPMSEETILQERIPLRGKIISDQELYEHIKDLPKKPLFMDFEGLRLSLAGVHDKAAVCLIEGKIALPLEGCPTTHILKPATPRFEGLIENEYMCLETGSQIGLNIPHKEIRFSKDIPYLLIERYDRKIKNGYVERIHQEDFCQALSILSTRKYQNEGGPGFFECFSLLENTVQPAIARNLLMMALIFNYLIGNMDAHGKNFSLLHLNRDQITLSPFYDLLCTFVYPELTKKMAMKIGSKYDAHAVFPRHWEQLCETIGYSYPALRQLIKKQGTDIVAAMETNKQFYIEMTRNKKIVEKVGAAVRKNIETTLEKFTL